MDFVTDLRKVADKCKFGTFRETAICDALVCGLGDNHVQMKLFAMT